MIILKEIHLYNAYYNKANTSPFETDTLYIKAIKSVLKNHNVSEKLFLQNMEYYLKNPEELAESYDTLITILIKEVAQLEAKSPNQ